MTFWDFGLTVVDLTTDLVPFLGALVLASLVRNRLEGALAVINLCLLMELVATIANPDYRFISLIAPRLIACTFQIIAACWLAARWRQRQRRLRSIAAH
ncbi:MAG: hypothetical protein ACR2Q4_20320 [Geminicoccaceae bacterium]